MRPTLLSLFIPALVTASFFVGSWHGGMAARSLLEPELDAVRERARHSDDRAASCSAKLLMKAREFVRDHVLPAGGQLLKKDGDHHVYRFPNGRLMVVPMGGNHSEARPYLVRRLEKLLAGTGT